MQFTKVSEILKNGQRGVLVTVLQSTSLLPGVQGSHWICKEETDRLVFVWTDGDNTGLMGSETLLKQLTQVCQVALEEGTFQRQKVQIDEFQLDLMLEPILPESRLVIMGCGHVGQALAKLADLAGFKVIVVDDRPDFANKNLFPRGVQVICADFLQAIEQIGLMEHDYLVIVTRGHQYDRQCLTQVAMRSLAYIGMIGSRRRIQGLFAELEKEGIEREWLSQVHSPIGLDIGAETPAEIGVSILAELIQVKRKGGTGK